jgi:hypothetical protein
MKSNNLDDPALKKAAELSALRERLSELENAMRHTRKEIQRLIQSPMEGSGSDTPQRSEPVFSDEPVPRLTRLSDMIPARETKLTRSSLRPAVFHGRPRPLRPWRD